MISPRAKVLEFELRAVRALCGSKDAGLSGAAWDRAHELQAQLQLLQGAQTQLAANFSARKEDPGAPEQGRGATPP